MEARIARALNLIHEDADLLVADQDDLLDLVDAFLTMTTHQVIPTNHTNANTVESRDYAPRLCMLGLGKSGEGAYTRDPNISV